MIDSLVKQIVQRVFWIPFRCLIADMHEKKDAGQLNGHSSAEEYDDYGASEDSGPSWREDCGGNPDLYQFCR